MAKGRQAPQDPAANAAAVQRAERDLNTEITAAVAATETEITDSIFGDEELDLVGDTDLEEMGEDLDGDTEVSDDDDEGDEQPAKAGAQEDEDEDDDDQGLEDPDVADVDDEIDDEQPLAADDDQDRSRGFRGRFVPRSRVTEEANRRRSAERQLDERDLEIARLRGQLEARNGGQQQPQQTQRTEEEQEPPVVDMFADPVGWEKRRDWLENKRVREAVKQAMDPILQENRQTFESRVNNSMNAVANGDRGDEFREAHATLTRLPDGPEKARLIQSIFNDTDPGAAVMRWWDEAQAQVADEYDVRVAQRLAQRYGFDLPPELQPARGARRDAPVRSREQPNGNQPPARQEFRRAQRLPSLNGAGGHVKHNVDPRGIDGSEQAIADSIWSN